MKSLRTVLGTILLTGLAGIAGCKNYDGRYSPRSEAHTDTTSGVSIATGDLDNDGIVEYVTGSPSAIKVFKQTGGGKFEEMRTIYEPYNEANTASASGIGVAIGDLDNDGLNDIVVASPSSVKTFKNLENLTFKEWQTVCSPYDNGAHTTSSSGIGIALADLDGDNDLDLLVASPSNVLVYHFDKGLFLEKPLIEDPEQK